MDAIGAFQEGVTSFAGPALPAFLAGLFAWSLLEYAIHGVLSHRFRTPVTPLHWGHHREPRAVFTSPLAWVPLAALIATICVAALGPTLGGASFLGMLLGFARYERTHWRIHFREPRNPRERRLRDHHLAHHFGHPDQYHGVTTRFWDGVFGTLPATWRDDYASVAHLAPLEGSSNWGLIWRGRLMSRPSS
jgi:sterol desaturase/sphingolipid hydroxylase (fatty acid hydroxylase superfamily)